VLGAASIYHLYLRHIVGNGEMAVPEQRVTALAKFIQPTTKKGLRLFLGYHMFIATHSSTLTPSTAQSAPDHLIWTSERVRAFRLLRDALYSRVALCVPTPVDTFVLCTDTWDRMCSLHD